MEALELVEQLLAEGVVREVERPGAPCSRGMQRRAAVAGSSGPNLAHFSETVANAAQRRSDLRSALGISPGSELAAHHIIPVELIQQSDTLRKAIEAGFDFNGRINGRALTVFSSKTPKGQLGRHASHFKYSQRVRARLRPYDNQPLTPQQARARIESICLAALQARDYRELDSALAMLERGLRDFPGDNALLIELADLAQDPRCKAELRLTLLEKVELEARAAGKSAIAGELWRASATLRSRMS